MISLIFTNFDQRYSREGKKVYIDIEPRVSPNFLSLVSFPTFNTAQALAIITRSVLWFVWYAVMVPVETVHETVGWQMDILWFLPGTVLELTMRVICDGRILYSSSVVRCTGYRGGIMSNNVHVRYTLPKVSFVDIPYSGNVHVTQIWHMTDLICHLVPYDTKGHAYKAPQNRGAKEQQPSQLSKCLLASLAVSIDNTKRTDHSITIQYYHVEDSRSELSPVDARCCICHGRERWTVVLPDRDHAREAIERVQWSARKPIRWLWHAFCAYLLWKSCAAENVGC